MLHKVENNLNRHVFAHFAFEKHITYIYSMYQLIHTSFFLKHKNSIRHFEKLVHVPFPSSTDNQDFWVYKKVFFLVSNMLLCSKFKYVT